MNKIKKRLRQAYESFDFSKDYSLEEALAVVQKCATAKFNETIEVAVNLNIDSRKQEQNVRGVVQLPHGTGKKLRVAVFARDEKAKEAVEAGADTVGAEDLADKIQAGSIDFDRCIATPDLMGVVGKLGKILGPRGLMPNPKLGTVTSQVREAVEAAKGGQIEYRSDKAGVVHAGIGKARFESHMLKENFDTFLSTLIKARPSGIKGHYTKKIYLSSTMGPSVEVKMTESEKKK